MSISLTRILQQITGLNTFFAGPSASRDNGVVLLDTATVTWGTDGQGNIQATASGSTLPTGSGNEVIATPANGSSGASALRALVSADLPVGSASQLGALQVDGSTITAAAGVISAVETMALISTTTVAAPATSVTISVPAGFTTYKLIYNCVATTSIDALVAAQVGNDTTANNYFTAGSVYGYGNASVENLNGFSSAGGIFVGPDGVGEATIYPATAFGDLKITAEGSGNGGNTGKVSLAGQYAGTNVLPGSSLTLQMTTLAAGSNLNGASFAVGSFFKLYGLN